MKTYRGDRTIDGIVVTVDDQPLDDAIVVQTLSEDGFEWGFEGPASEQLALAILYDHLGDAERSSAQRRLYARDCSELCQRVGNDGKRYRCGYRELEGAS